MERGLRPRVEPDNWCGTADAELWSVDHFYSGTGIAAPSNTNSIGDSNPLSCAVTVKQPDGSLIESSLLRRHDSKSSVTCESCRCVP